MEAGLTITVLPVPTLVTPQLPLYHFQLAPVPKEPPLMLKLVDEPAHMVVFVALMLNTGTEVSRTAMVTFLQTVLLQVPSALTE